MFNIMYACSKLVYNQLYYRFINKTIFRLLIFIMLLNRNYNKALKNLIIATFRVMH